MKKRQIMIMVMALLIAGPAWAAQDAPDFTLASLDGSKVTLSELQGKPSVLVFTTTWCIYCKREIPNLKKVYAEYGDKLNFLAIYIKESDKTVQYFVDKQKLPYPILLDSDGAVATAYGVRGVPMVAVLDAAGKIVSFPSHNLEEDVKSVLK